jgi:hypothetical protein
MLPNEVFALECRKRYEEQGLVVDKRNGQFAHCPLPEGMGDEGLYLLWGDHQHQGLLQSRDVGRRCFWAADVKLWLDTFPEGFFELYDIYQEFISGEHGPCYGRTQWKNELTQQQRVCFDKPEGEGWERGQLQKTLDKKSAATSGKNNSQYGRTGALNPRSKAIIAIKPGGERVIFEGCYQAARELNIGRQTMLNYLNKGGELSARSKYPGWQFRYV